MESSPGKPTDLLTSAQPTNYGAASVVDPRQLDKRRAEQAAGSSGSGGGRVPCHVRLLLYTLIFLAGSISYALRVSLSQALVAMVNDTSHRAAAAAAAAYNATDAVCPRDDAPLGNATSDDDVTRGGKFDWDRNAQGAVLAAFYYGYALIQVNQKKRLKNVGPIRHCEPPHAACFRLPFTRCRYCRTLPAHRCPQQQRQQRQRVTEGTAMAHGMGPKSKYRPTCLTITW